MTTVLTKLENENLQLARSFGQRDKLLRECPALFTTHPHQRLSARYAFTNTYELCVALMTEGYRISSVQGGRTKYAKMMVRMRMPEHIFHGSSDGKGAPEIIIMDSHDGTSRLRMAMGWLEFVCMNGMIAGTKYYDRSFIHTTDDLMAHMMLEIRDIGVHTDKLVHTVYKMRNRPTTIGTRIRLADAAINARFNEDRGESFRLGMRKQLLATRRPDDEETNLYTVMNVIQENILRGGFYYYNNGQHRRMQDLRSVDRSIRVNRMLWDAADAIMIEGKAN